MSNKTLDASLTHTLTRLSAMAVCILLNYIYVYAPAITYMNIRSAVLRTWQLHKYISLRPACTQARLLSDNYVQGYALPPLAYVQCTKGYPKKSASVQARGNMHTQFLISIALSVLLVMGGCTSISVASEQIKMAPLGVISTSIITPEGYILFTTTDLSLVRKMCAAITDIPEKAIVFGCSKWNFEDEVGDKHDPKGPCLAIAMMGVAPDGENVIEHELRHCREGYFHG